MTGIAYVKSVTSSKASNYVTHVIRGLKIREELEGDSKKG